MPRPMQDVETGRVRRFGGEIGDTRSLRPDADVVCGRRMTDQRAAG